MCTLQLTCGLITWVTTGEVSEMLYNWDGYEFQGWSGTSELLPADNFFVYI